MKAVKWIAVILVIIGGLNWGLVGLFGYNLVSSLLGEGALTNIIYDLVGLSAILTIFSAKKAVE